MVGEVAVGDGGVGGWYQPLTAWEDLLDAHVSGEKISFFHDVIFIFRWRLVLGVTA